MEKNKETKEMKTVYPMVRKLDLLDSYRYMVSQELNFQPYLSLTKCKLQGLNKEELCGTLSEIDIDYYRTVPYTSGFYIIPDPYDNKPGLVNLLSNSLKMDLNFFTEQKLINLYINYVFFIYTSPLISTPEYEESKRKAESIISIFKDYGYTPETPTGTIIEKIEGFYKYIADRSYVILVRVMADLSKYSKEISSYTLITLDEQRLECMYDNLIELLVNGPLKFEMGVIRPILKKLYAYDSIKLHEMSMSHAELLFTEYAEQLMNIIPQEPEYKEAIIELQDGIRIIKSDIKSYGLFTQLNLMHGSTDKIK